MSDHPTDGPVVVHGRPASDAEKEALAKLRSIVELEKGADRVRAYTEWIFGLGATLTLLATGLGAGFVTQFGTWSVTIFGLAVFLFAWSLVFSTLAKRPRWEQFLAASPSSMQQALERALASRRKWIISATGCLVGALALAGLVPVVGHLEDSPSVRVDRVALAYRVKADTIEASLVGAYVEPHVGGRVSVYHWNGFTHVFLGGTMATADSLGALRAFVRLPPPPDAKAGDRLLILGAWQERPGGGMRQAEPVRVELPIHP